MKLIKIDLSKADKHNHPDISLDKFYLAKISDYIYTGTFSEQHYGLNFNDGWAGGVGHQFDAPGYNSSRWQELYEVVMEEDKNHFVSLLQTTRKFPKMFAATKEALIMRVSTILECANVDFDIYHFYKKHLSDLNGILDDYSDDWAKSIIDDAIHLILIGA